jgi:hypothetical protein
MRQEMSAQGPCHQTVLAWGQHADCRRRSERCSSSACDLVIPTPKLPRTLVDPQSRFNASCSRPAACRGASRPHRRCASRWRGEKQSPVGVRPVTPIGLSPQGFIVPRPRFREKWLPARRPDRIARGALTRRQRPSVSGPKPASSRRMHVSSQPSSTVLHVADHHNRSVRGSRWTTHTTPPCASHMRRSIARSIRRSMARYGRASVPNCCPAALGAAHVGGCQTMGG